MLKTFAVYFLPIIVATQTFAAEKSIDIAYSPKETKLMAPVVTEKYEYYWVLGQNEEELVHDLKGKCITWNDGNKYDSITNWEVKWDYGHDSRPGACRAESFKVFVEIIFRYPRWARPDNAPRPLTEKWDFYIRRLIEHESGHRDRVVEAATWLTRAVAELPPSPTCAEIDWKVSALSRKWMEEMNRDQRRYDASTRHGVNQGAKFP